MNKINDHDYNKIVKSIREDKKRNDLNPKEVHYLYAKLEHATLSYGENGDTIYIYSGKYGILGSLTVEQAFPLVFDEDLRIIGVVTLDKIKSILLKEAEKTIDKLKSTGILL